MFFSVFSSCMILRNLRFMSFCNILRSWNSKFSSSRVLAGWTFAIILRQKWKACWKRAPSPRATCQIWEARAWSAKGIPQTQRIRTVAREGKRKFEFLGVTDAEGRKDRGNPTGNAGMNSKRAWGRDDESR